MREKSKVQKYYTGREPSVLENGAAAKPKGENGTVGNALELSEKASN
jgi:hypothetical protein